MTTEHEPATLTQEASAPRGTPQDYAAFLSTKAKTLAPTGPSVTLDAVHPMLFPFQRALVVWALRRGRAALFADTGLGKTFMQLEWARLLDKRTLIVAPLSVARQSAREAAKLRHLQSIKDVLISNGALPREKPKTPLETDEQMIERYQGIVADEDEPAWKREAAKEQLALLGVR